ncbi:Glutamyl-tRNA(Gln) amidotransferase subunit A, mitochondrial [Smittium culicis]|uniref:Glutamyl-tRNA(Gln) amidotransferase subunit A, mitochondrial n=3 Tax=Smittium culicis TaxID=133412 RepID=A0A1R1Y167_9FUNG|nr:Glutamyl-tRNA(Gln) amidotransferase subunit A, mitochondrial [Smittium culicis]
MFSIDEIAFVSSIYPYGFKAWKFVANVLKDLGATLKSVSLPHTKYGLSAYYTITAAEASSNLARYDGIRYGARKDILNTSDDIGSDASNKYSIYRESGLGPEVKKRIIAGNYVLSLGAQKSYYEKAQKIRRLIQEDFDSVFRLPNSLNETLYNEIDSRKIFDQIERDEVGEKVDLLIMPTSTSTAPTLNEVMAFSASRDLASSLESVKDSKFISNSTKIYVNDVMTVPSSLAGIPAASIPAGLCKGSLCPIGLQVVGQFGDDELVLNTIQILEEALRSRQSIQDSNNDFAPLVPKISY